MSEIKDICIVGLGYIGLPSAALLANRGFSIHGVDIDEKTVEIINRGEIHIVEPGLDSFVHSAVNSGHLKASITPKEADVFILAVPTPFHEGHVPNIDYVVSATKAIAPFLKKGNLVILESTSPVGTTEKVRDVLQDSGVNTSEIFISHCPERVLPGRIMIELIENDRIVGGIDEASTEKTVSFYKQFVQGEVLSTDAKTAEMAKLTENSFRDVNIAFANELSILCDQFGINVWELIRLANHHPRVNILQPGCGVGGHCIAVDPWFIVHAGGKNANLIRSAREKNDYKSDWVVEKIKNSALEFEIKNGRRPVIACMGLAFKPNIDDLRESPALKITRELMSQDLSIVAVEPNVQDVEGIKIVPLDLLEADVIVYLVGHSEFKNYESTSLVLDFCGVKK